MSHEVWSFSRANCYDDCPYNYKLAYKDKVDKSDNAFAEWGSLVHKCLELYFKGELDLFTISDYYESHYDEYVKDRFPYDSRLNLSERYHEAGDIFLSDFQGIDSDKYEVVGVEEYFKLDINGVMLQGYIDLVIKRKSDGALIIVDHKSVSSLNGKKLKEYQRQLYLYSTHIKEKYGTFPSLLVFNLFRENKVNIATFNHEDYRESLSWFSQVVHDAQVDLDFTDKITAYHKLKNKDINTFKCNDFFCNNLCSVRAYCKRSADYEGDDCDWL